MEPIVLKPRVGVGNPVSLRAIVQPDGLILWAADAVMDEISGGGYVGLGSSPTEAYANLGQTLAFHAIPIADVGEVEAA